MFGLTHAITELLMLESLFAVWIGLTLMIIVD
jgi:hypothetical protein